MLEIICSASVASELYWNKLNFSYGINFKYNGLINHDIDRVWVVTKVQIPDISELKFPEIDFDMNCVLLNKYAQEFPYAATYVQGIRALCMSVQPLLHLIKSKRDYYASQINKLYSEDIREALGLSPYSIKCFKRGTSGTIDSVGE